MFASIATLTLLAITSCQSLSIYCKTSVSELSVDCNTSTGVSRCFRNLDNCLLHFYCLVYSFQKLWDVEVFAIHQAWQMAFITSVKLSLDIFPLF